MIAWRVRSSWPRSGQPSKRAELEVMRWMTSKPYTETNFRGGDSLEWNRHTGGKSGRR